jgi:capsular polysaccharide biosynthesis protein
MTLTNAVRHRLRVAAASALAGLVVGGLVTVAVMMRPPEFDGRIGLVAVPVTATEGSADEYGEVVSLGLPALTELARSPSMLRDVAASVPNSPPVEELFESVTVELVPGSGVARLTVRADDGALAGALAEQLTRRVIDADVLSPSARLRALDTQADIQQVSPNLQLGIGLALIAAVLAALTTAVYLRSFRPHVRGSSPILDALADVGSRPVAVLDGRDPVLVNRILVLQQAANRPLRVVPVGPGLDGRVNSLSGALSENDARLSVNGDATRAAVVAVMDKRQSRSEELAATVHALPPESVLVAVVLQ